MLRRIYLASLAVAFLIGISSHALAQGRGMTGGMGGGGMSSGFGGMSGSGFGGMGGSGFGGMGMGSMGRGGGMSGMGGMGMGGMGGGSAFGGMGTSAFGQSGRGGMYGGQGGGQAFVGRDGADMSAVMNQMGRAGTQFFNQMNRNMRQGGRNNRNQRANSNQAQPGPASDVRVKLELAFTPVRATPSALTNTVRTRLTNVLPAQGIATPDVTVEGDVVVLRGVAASENQRQVLERFISLEPGVRGIRNEMTVAGADEQNQ